ncbi:hypothetical protein FISHEDRAFT_38064 [Fistulina hepatica ATCC 64428]|nr:hypothetical protein FISHEDRAFT_38064 [Fistulina hepatica ATCC 64428]
MAQPSSSHERHHRNERASSSHRHRTISSTTLLLVLSLILAVLAVMLSLPSNTLAGSSSTEGNTSGVLSLFTPRRTQALIQREHNVAQREAEIARREAELLAGAPGGVLPPPPPSCAPCIQATAVETVIPPAQTIIQEVVKEASLTPPGYGNMRVDDIIERELRIAEREREISKREENVNRREHDATRRENWIMEQLVALGSDSPVVEEEYIYNEPPSARRKPIANKYRELPQLVVSETLLATPTVTATSTVTMPAPSSTRLVADPSPQTVQPSTGAAPRTTAVEVVMEEVPNGEDDIYEEEYRSYQRGPRRPPSRWW